MSRRVRECTVCVSLTMRSRSSSIALMSRPNSLSEPAITISSSVWLLPMHSNWKLMRLDARLRWARDRAVGGRRESRGSTKWHRLVRSGANLIAVGTTDGPCARLTASLGPPPRFVVTAHRYASR